MEKHEVNTTGEIRCVLNHVHKIEELLELSRSFMGQKVVPEEELYLLLVQLRKALPPYLVQAQNIEQQIEVLLSKARIQAEEVTSQAQQQQESILMQAQTERQRILAEAETQAEAIKQQAQRQRHELVGTAIKTGEQIRQDALQQVEQKLVNHPLIR
jgi:cell division septum initiation protein DivIVA